MSQPVSDDQDIGISTCMVISKTIRILNNNIKILINKKPFKIGRKKNVSGDISYQPISRNISVYNGSDNKANISYSITLVTD